MAQVKTESSFAAGRPAAGNEIFEFTKHLSTQQKSTVQKVAKVLVQLSPSQKRAVLALLQKRNGNGGLDYRWLTNLFTVLKKLKEEENKLHPK